MLNPDLTEDEVQAAVGALNADDPETARRAAHAWMELTAGEGPGMISLAGLQNWAWWLLPKRAFSSGHDVWAATVEAAGVLFDRLGAPRYAELCRSEVTAKVLAAWRASRPKGLEAARKAKTSSPVEPPDLEDFAWGTVFGTWENGARSAVELALERALDDGRLDPASRRWRATAAAVCAEVLDGEAPGEVGQSWRSLVLSERAEQWVSGPGTPPGERDERHQIANRYLSPPEPPDAELAAKPLGPLAWLADACADGVKLTASDYLPRALVVEAVEWHGWWEWDKPPRSEADVWELQLVHRAARGLGIVRRRGRTLKTTQAGRSVGSDPLVWWPRLVLLGQGGDEYRDALFEVAALAITDGATHEIGELRAQIGERLAAQEWRTDQGVLSATDHGRRLYGAINPWRIWGFVDYRSGDVQRPTVTITPAGLAAAELWLHHRIAGPRHRL